MLNRLASLLAAIIFLAGCATPPPIATSNERGDYSHTQKYLSWLVDREMAQNEITGLSIALVDDQKVIWQQGFGYADLENKILATPETVYRAGSIAKVYSSCSHATGRTGQA